MEKNPKQRIWEHEIEGKGLYAAVPDEIELSLASVSAPNGWGQALRNLFRLRRHAMVESEVLEELFLMERKTLVTIMLLETILLYVLAPLLGDAVFVWYGIILTLTMWRYYNAHDYRSSVSRNSPLVWHQKFVVQTWMTALLFSLLALFAMPQLNEYYQLFVFIVIIGISTGAAKTLANDHRTAIGYLLILLLPLAAEMLLLKRQETFILAFLVILYLFTQVSILLKSYEQSVRLRRAREAIVKTKELLYEKQEMVQQFFEQAAEGIFTYDRELKILDCNHSFISFFHFSKEEIVGKKVSDLPDDKLVTIIKASMVEGVQSFRGSYRSRRGEELWIEAKCSSLYNQSGRVIGGLGLIEDKTREHLAMEELEFLVSHDPLTSALNRRGFRHYMQHLVRQDEHLSKYTLVFYLDLDRFKQVNDFYSHQMGDLVLIETAKRLKQLKEEESGFARLGGDEFCLVIPFVHSDKSVVETEIRNRVEKIEREISRPYILEGQKLDIGCSIGVVVFEPGAENIDEVVQHADISMLQAKKNSKERYAVYVPQMGEDYRKLHRFQTELELALEQDQFELHYQPIVRIGDGSLQAAEVLIRWKHPEKGLLAPSEFLPAAIRFGKIAEIDEWVLEKVCRQIAAWKERGEMPVRYLSVNMDTHLLFRDGFVEMLQKMLDRHGVRPSELKLEIIEDSLIDNFEAAQKILESLHTRGIECAIDDFGTGYSSLSYLKKLSFGILKIDREFVQGMMQRIENIFLIQTIIEMGRKLNYRIVVEGIETERQREIIANIDPDVGCQGYLISRPLQEKDFSRNYFENRFVREEIREDR